MIFIFTYFWINAFLMGVISTTEVVNKGNGNAKVKMLLLTMLFGLPMYIIHIIKNNICK